MEDSLATRMLAALRQGQFAIPTTVSITISSAPKYVEDSLSKSPYAVLVEEVGDPVASKDPLTAIFETVSLRIRGNSGDPKVNEVLALATKNIATTQGQPHMAITGTTRAATDEKTGYYFAQLVVRSLTTIT